MATGENIKKLRLLCGLTLEQLSELSGVEVGTISALEVRDSSRSKFFPNIAKAFGITSDELASEISTDQIVWATTMKAQAKGDAPEFWMTTTEIAQCVFDKVKKDRELSPSSNTNAMTHDSQSHSNVEAGPDVRGRIPLISWVQAGMWSEAVDIYEPGYAERWLPFLKSNGEKTFALRVVGDSMTARFGKSYPEGCVIFVDPENRTPENGDRIIAKLEDTQEVTFKVFTKDAGRCWLRPLNDSHPPIYDAFSVVGKVIGKWEDD